MKLSIITINYNNAAGLKKTLDSVAIQTATDFEHIIVDGASTDDSVEIIREYADNQAMRLTDYEAIRNGENCKAENNTSTPHRLVWLSEPDTGIYNAMNKGIKLAKGEYTLMLNSGDYLVDEYVIEKILPLLDGTDIIQGNVVVEQNGKEIIRRGYGKSDINFIDVMCGDFLHQASFFRLILFTKYGNFDESYKIGGDTVFYAKCLGFGNASFKYIDINVSNFDDNGISAKKEGIWYEIHKAEDIRYEKMFSQRMWNMRTVELNKIRLYDRLHEHKWSWKLTMVISFMLNLIYGKKK